jgi:uncharacterized Zn-finger protein
MADAPETIKVDTTHVHCDGGAKDLASALGHPRVYLQIKPEIGEIECPYCSRHYVLEKGAHAHAGH